MVWLYYQNIVIVVECRIRKSIFHEIFCIMQTTIIHTVRTKVNVGWIWAWLDLGRRSLAWQLNLLDDVPVQYYFDS